MTWSPVVRIQNTDEKPIWYTTFNHNFRKITLENGMEYAWFSEMNVGYYWTSIKMEEALENPTDVCNIQIIHNRYGKPMIDITRNGSNVLRQEINTWENRNCADWMRDD